MKRLGLYYRRGTVVYDACIPHTNDVALEKRLKDASPAIEAAEKRLWAAWEAGDPSVYQRTDLTTIDATKSDLQGVYSRVLRDGAERDTYEQILGLAFGICPQCGVSGARTLDHFLPQSSFPELAVIPANLVPVCGDCNFFKRNEVPTSIEECVFNPYYDDWSAYELFSATLTFDEPVTAKFAVADIETNPVDIRERAVKHFAAFKLARAFAVASANALSSVKASCELMAKLATAFGQPARPMVEKWVTDQLKTARGKDASSWETALYAACSASDEFLDGGYKQISTAVPVVVAMPA